MEDLLLLTGINLFFGIICTCVLIVLLRIFFAPTKRTSIIILFIFVGIANIFDFVFSKAFEIYDSSDYDLWQIIMAILIVYISLYRIGYSLMKSLADVCPYCGEWNRLKSVGYRFGDRHKQIVDVERDIRNKGGEKIGSYDAQEIRDVRTSYITKKCIACGESFEDWRTTVL